MKNEWYDVLMLGFPSLKTGGKVLKLTEYCYDFFPWYQHEYKPNENMIWND